MQQTLPDEAFFLQRHNLLTRRLTSAVNDLILKEKPNSFLFDLYPDYLSLRLFEERIISTNKQLTAEFLQAGWPVEFLREKTGVLLTALLIFYRKPSGDARMTSV